MTTTVISDPKMVKSDQPFLNRVLMCRRLFFDNILSVLNFQKNFIENHNHLLKSLPPFTAWEGRGEPLTRGLRANFGFEV